MSERINDMSTSNACEAAAAYQAAKASRQCMYQLAKIVPSYRDMYEQMEATYQALCGRLGAEFEPVFDIDEYRKSDRYQAILEGRIR